MAKLDRQKDFGIITGDESSPKKLYEQGGKYFDAEGDEIGAPKAVDQKTLSVPAPKTAVDDQIAKQ